jgi:MoaA/NifB/PqqE/SkfB family radical SAM enzyme
MMTLLRRRTRARIQLATNALLLTPDLSRALLELGIDFISFSLDALRRETYEKIRVGGSFDRAMENVHAFLGLRKHRIPCVTVVQV